MRTKTLEQNTAQDFAGLQINVLQKLRTGNMTYEQFDWFANISYENREKLMGKSVKTEHPKMKFTDSNIIIGELVAGYNPQQYFTENKKVNYWRSDNFNQYVLNPAKIVNNIPEMNFSKYKFTETIYDKEIMEHFQISESKGLMTREEILWTIASLTTKQPKGESGILLNNGYATIIGYMLCDDSVVRAVSVLWGSGGAKWFCYCYGLGVWLAGSEVLSRN
jgi:hypothetical protein